MVKSLRRVKGVFQRMFRGALLGVWVVGFWTGISLSATSYGLYRSFDRGVTWSQGGDGLLEGLRINGMCRSIEGRVLAATDSGIYGSGDLGATWRLIEGTDQMMGRVLCLERVGEEVFAGTEGRGLWVSDGDGSAWKPVPGEHGFSGGTVRSLLGVGETGVVGMEDGRVFRRMVRGGEWKSLGVNGPAGSQVLALESVGGRLFAGLYGRGLFEWQEEGEVWQRLDGVTPLVLAEVGGNLLVGHNPGGIQGNGLRGDRWFVGKMDFSGSFGPDLASEADILTDESPVWAMGSNGDWVIAGAGSGIYYSSDSGRTWVKGAGGLPEEYPGIAFYVGKDVVLAVTGKKPY